MMWTYLPSDALTAPSTAERGYPLFVPESEEPDVESPLPQWDAVETFGSASSYSDEDFNIGPPKKKNPIQRITRSTSRR